MIIDPEKFYTDESKSNPMVVALSYPGCPIGKPCAFMVVGSGAITEQCEHLKEKGDGGECTYNG